MAQHPFLALRMARRAVAASRFSCKSAPALRVSSAGMTPGSCWMAALYLSSCEARLVRMRMALLSVTFFSEWVMNQTMTTMPLCLKTDSRFFWRFSAARQARSGRWASCSSTLVDFRRVKRVGMMPVSAMRSTFVSSLSARVVRAREISSLVRREAQGLLTTDASKLMASSRTTAVRASVSASKMSFSVLTACSTTSQLTAVSPMSLAIPSAFLTR
mmetsp:Transcript_5992/g.18833  ORF Transcript_5992/g.18833 Transcript_5992/m.18833 type:complete len:216 (-) Transcript_5992:51-698(-)